MKSKLVPAAISAVLVISLLGATGASAATEFGDNCVGNESIEAPITLFEISSTLDPLPTASPISGVITRWNVNLIPVPVFIPVNLKVLRQTGPNTAQIVGEALGNITGGSNSFSARIPVLAGDRLGFFSPSVYGPIVCEEPSGSAVFGGYEGSGGGVGSSVVFVTIPVSEARIPLFAAVEPDADGDGFGDETQDACPQSAASQAACPVVSLNVSATAKKKLVNVLVTSTTAANVTVNGKVNLGGGKKAKLKGGTKAVNPGKFTKFKLKFSAKLLDRLEELSPKRSLTLKITSSAPNVASAPTKKTIKVKLKGQG